MFFSSVKTIKRALNKTNSGDFIQLLPKVYKESIHFEKDVTICGDKSEPTVIEGIFIIPRNVTVTFQNVIILPTSQIYVEGEVIFKYCQIKGQNSEVLVTVNSGKVKAYYCEFNNSLEVAIALMNVSEGIFENCRFHHNGIIQILIDKSNVSVEKCNFSHTKHCYWLKEKSFLQSKNTHIHHHNGTQILIDHSTYIDYKSIIERSEGNALFASEGSEIILSSSIIRFHSLPQVWIQNSDLKANKCTIQHGKESGIISQNSEVQLTYCEISHHESANIQVTKESLVNLEHCHIHSSNSFGIQVRDQSIINCFETIIKNHRFTQLFVTDKSICTMKKSLINEGQHIGILIEKESNCTLVECKIYKNTNSAIAVFSGHLTVFECEVMQNKGNGILGVSDSIIELDSSNFYDNEMPHIASKSNVKIYIFDCDLFNGKSIFIVDQCEVFARKSKFFDSDNVQIELSNQSTGRFEQCQIFNGKSYGIKVLKNSNFFFLNSQLYNHKLAQMVINDSSVVIKNSELYEGCKNALFIQNHSEAFIQDSYISNHLKPQIWVDLESSVELKSVQLTDGHQSDLFAQNQSSVYVFDSIIRNEKYRFNVQALNFSKIELFKTIVENKFGDSYYSENHSFIKNSDI